MVGGGGWCSLRIREVGFLLWEKALYGRQRKWGSERCGCHKGEMCIIGRLILWHS